MFDQSIFGSGVSSVVKAGLRTLSGACVHFSVVRARPSLARLCTNSIFEIGCARSRVTRRFTIAVIAGFISWTPVTAGKATAIVSLSGLTATYDGTAHTVLASQQGVVTTFAGTAGSPGSIDGMGSFARFNQPQGTAVDSAGNIYIADTFNSTIRKMTPSGQVTTLAGKGLNAGSADGAGSSARFNVPYSVAVDGVGNVYVADSGNHTIRKITAAGVVTTLAGTAGSSGSNDGTGSAARFYQPQGVAVDGAGNVYVADTYNCTIRKITSAGVVSTLAGSAGVTGSDNGLGSAARFYQPNELAVD